MDTTRNGLHRVTVTGGRKPFLGGFLPTSQSMFSMVGDLQGSLCTTGNTSALHGPGPSLTARLALDLLHEPSGALRLREQSLSTLSGGLSFMFFRPS